jgi:hypothetical protein
LPAAICRPASNGTRASSRACITSVGTVFDASGVNDGFQVVHERLERNFLDLSIRQAVAACVVSDQRMIPRENYRRSSLGNFIIG